MEDLWKALWAKLSGDATLVSMVGYTTTTKTIKRSNNTRSIAFTNLVTRAVTFGEWADARLNRSSTSGLRNISFMISY